MSLLLCFHAPAPKFEYTDRVSKKKFPTKRDPGFMPVAIGAEEVQIEWVGRSNCAKIQYLADDVSNLILKHHHK